MKLLKKIILATIIIYIIIIIANNIVKTIYPMEYKDYVYQYSKQHNIDPLLTFAIIKSESNFRENAVSHSNAKGLMQLMDNTAIELAEEEGIDYIEDETLFNPEENIKLGTKYIKVLLDTYDGNIVLALTAYNAGIGNVEKWRREGIIKQDGTDVENIPFKETSMYVRKILRDYQMYMKIY